MYIWNILIQLHFRQRFMLSEPFNAIEAHHLHKTDCIFKWISTQHYAWFHSFESHFYDDETTLHTPNVTNHRPAEKKRTNKYRKRTLKHILSFSCWKINCAPEEEKNTHTQSGILMWFMPKVKESSHFKYVLKWKCVTLEIQCLML